MDKQARYYEAMKLIEYLSNFQGPTVVLVGPLAEEESLRPVTGHDPLNSYPLIFVDGGARLQTPGVGYSVGDGDSYLEKGSESHLPLNEKLDVKKDFSDLAYVLSQIPSQFTMMKLIGFSGGRKDHELMNWAEVHRFLEQAQRPTEVHVDKSVLVFSKGNWLVSLHGTFSVFTFKDTTVKLSGSCEFPTDVLRSLSSQGLSNKGFGEVRLTCEGPVFIFI